MSNSNNRQISQRLDVGFMLGSQGKLKRLEECRWNIEATATMTGSEAVFFSHIPSSQNIRPMLTDKPLTRTGGLEGCPGTALKRRGQLTQLAVSRMTCPGAFFVWRGN
jgi:hypothetical protein